MSYTILFDNGKPYSLEVEGDEGLRFALKKFLEENENNDYPYDAEVFRGEENITDTLLIQEMIQEIKREVYYGD